MTRWIAVISVLSLIGCASLSQRPSMPAASPSSSRRPTEFEVRKNHPEVQKYFRTGAHRVYSAAKSVVRDQGWQIVTDRFLGTEAKIEGRKGSNVATVFIQQVTPVQTRVTVLVNGNSSSGTAAGVHGGLEDLLRLPAED